MWPSPLQIYTPVSWLRRPLEVILCCLSPFCNSSVGFTTAASVAQQIIFSANLCCITTRSHAEALVETKTWRLRSVWVRRQLQITDTGGCGWNYVWSGKLLCRKMCARRLLFQWWTDLRVLPWGPAERLLMSAGCAPEPKGRVWGKPGCHSESRYLEKYSCFPFPPQIFAYLYNFI